MLYLGEYDEDEAADIRSYLGDAGIRVETKPCLMMDSDEVFRLRGRYSRLVQLAEDMSDFEHYLSLIKSALSQSSSKEEFDELFLYELDPEMMKMRDEILGLPESNEDESMDESMDKSMDELSEEPADQISEDDVSRDAGEESEKLDFNSEKWLRFMLKSEKAKSFAHSVLSLNGIVIGEPFGDKLDDPLLEIPADPDDFDPRPDELMLNVECFLSRSAALYVDEFTTPLSSEIDEEFCELYPDEYHQISALGMLIEKLATPPSGRKMSKDEFAEGCMLRVDRDGVSLLVDGKDVAGELIRILEKGDVIRSKGDKIKWKNS